MSQSPPHRVVIIGGGFAGLYAAKALRRADEQVLLLDRRNYHLFQPLLYQVATGGLSPGDISSPLRHVLKKQPNARVLLVEVTDIDTAAKEVVHANGRLPYDTLIVASGSRHHYFGKSEWEPLAPGLKAVEEATEIRRRILLAFERAELEADEEKRRRLLTFVVVGAGPTGVELAGALSELARDTLRREFRAIRPEESRILLIEGRERVLPTFPPDLSAKAEASLARLGVTVWKNALVTALEDGVIHVRATDRDEVIQAGTVLWAAGIRASPLGRIVAERTGAKVDPAGRVFVEHDLTIAGHPEIFVIGDLAHFAHQGGQPLPALATVAMQEGRYVAEVIQRRRRGEYYVSFRYFDKGLLATIGRSRAVAALGRFHFSGFAAWVLWLVVHIFYLIGFENRILVMVQWAWNYFGRNRSARLITGEKPRD